MSGAKRYILSGWRAEAARRFGPDAMKWAFRCPSCGHVATVADWKAAGAEEGAVAFSCVGRWTANPSPEDKERATFKRAGGPCHYAGGGLLRINPVTVTDETGGEHQLFAFADPGPLPSPKAKRRVG